MDQTCRQKGKQCRLSSDGPDLQTEGQTVQTIIRWPRPADGRANSLDYHQTAQTCRRKGNQCRLSSTAQTYRRKDKQCRLSSDGPDLQMDGQSVQTIIRWPSPADGRANSVDYIQTAQTCRQKGNQCRLSSDCPDLQTEGQTV